MVLNFFKGLGWFVMMLIFGMTPIYGVIALVMLIMSVFLPLALFGLGVIATQKALVISMIVLFVVAGLVYEPTAPWNRD